jgi:hypothetical protein
VIEIMTFRLRPGADEATFIEADRRVQTGFAYRQSGLLRRTTARSADGEWVVIDLWRSAADADSCAERWDDDPSVANFMSLVESSTVRTRRFATLD